MRPGRAAALVAQNIRRGWRGFLLSLFGICMGIAALSFFLALSQGVRQGVLGRIFPAGRIEVVPARSSLESGPLGGLGSLLGGPRPIDEQVVAALRALPQVRAVYPRMQVSFPVMGWGGEKLLGHPVATELIIDGIDPQAVSEATAPLRFGDLSQEVSSFCTGDEQCQAPAYCAWDVNRCQLPVPVLVSPMLLELYNGTLAKAHNLPRIGSFLASQFRGMTFNAELGKAFGSGRVQGTQRRRRLMLVGVSERAIAVGITAPLAYVQRWNAEYAGAQAAKEYSSVSVEVRPGASVTAVVEAARKLGYAIADNGAEQAGLAVTLLTAVFVLVSLVIVLVSLVNIGHTFFRAVAERRRELGVMRALGASAWDVQLLVLGEAAALGLCGGVAGLLVAGACSWGVDWLSLHALPDFPFKPATYFRFSPGLCLGAVAFSVGTCVAGALWPARSAARLSPAAALTSL